MHTIYLTSLPFLFAISVPVSVVYAELDQAGGTPHPRAVSSEASVPYTSLLFLPNP